MTVLPLVIAPDDRLHICSEPVEKVDSELQSFMDNMLETMYFNKGIGLAAVQVGVHKRIITMHIEDDDPYYMVNPEILEKSEELSIYEEGCLSYPRQTAKVVRPASLKVKYLDYYGNEKTEEFIGIHATCVQHEIDHINGVVFIDNLSKIKKDLILGRVKKFKKLYFEEGLEEEE